MTGPRNVDPIAPGDLDALLDAFPGVRIDADNAAHYAGLLREQLLIHRCGDCGHWHHPPRPMCPKCWSWNIEPTEVEGTGSISFFTILRQGGRRPGVDYSNGHPVVAVELDEQPGLRVAATIVGTDPAELVVGQRVAMRWTHLDGLAPRADFEVTS